MKSKIVQAVVILMVLCLAVVTSSLLCNRAFATGPASCPAGQTALAQLWGTSQYCALSSCRVEYQHADRLACIKGHCYSVEKYEARPVLPSPPSPAGGWQGQVTCPSWTNTATWY